jgi:hypothetical protein
MTAQGKYPDADTVRAIMAARSQLEKLVKKHPKRSALLRLRLLEAQTDYRDRLIDEVEFRIRLTDITERASSEKSDEKTPIAL